MILIRLLPCSFYPIFAVITLTSLAFSFLPSASMVNFLPNAFWGTMDRPPYSVMPQGFQNPCVLRRVPEMAFFHAPNQLDMARNTPIVDRIVKGLVTQAYYHLFRPFGYRQGHAAILFPSKTMLEGNTPFRE